MSTAGFSDEHFSSLIAGANSVIRNGDGRTIDLLFDDKYSDEQIRPVYLESR